MWIDASEPGGYSGNDAVNLATGATWAMICGGNTTGTAGTRAVHEGVPVFDLSDSSAACRLEATDDVPICGLEPRNGGGDDGVFTIAAWVWWRQDSHMNRDAFFYEYLAKRLLFTATCEELEVQQVGSSAFSIYGNQTRVRASRCPCQLTTLKPARAFADSRTVHRGI